MDEIFVDEGEFVHKGIQIGTIGNNNDMYLAHLHFEIRDNLDLPIGGDPKYSIAAQVDI